MACSMQEESFGRLRAVSLKNELLSATVLPDKGADIYRLVHQPSGVDVLWKSPWGVRAPGVGTAPAPDSATSWLEHYEGGWQELFPNGGDACLYQGVELPFHGEASTLPWDWEVLSQGPDEAAIRFSVRLFRSPFRLTRTMRLRTGSPVLLLEEEIVNEGAEPLAAMWSHHPAFGAPFLAPGCLIDTGARTVAADAAYITPKGRIQPSGRLDWPEALAKDGSTLDLRRVPDDAGDMLAYLGDFDEGWFALTNPTLGFGLAMCWPISVFPHAWLWQELRASSGFPWYGNCYTMAIEPASSIPGQGLVNVIEQTGTQLTLGPGERRSAWLRTAFYDAGSGHGVARVDADGNVTLRTTNNP